MPIDTALEEIDEQKTYTRIKPVDFTPEFMIPTDKVVAAFDVFKDLRDKYFYPSGGKVHTVNPKEVRKDTEEFEPYYDFCNQVRVSTWNIYAELTNQWIKLFENVDLDAENDKNLHPDLKECMLCTIEDELKAVQKESTKFSYEESENTKLERRVYQVNTLVKGFYNTGNLIDAVYLGKSLASHSKLLWHWFGENKRLGCWDKLSNYAVRRRKDITYECWSDNITLKN